MATGIQITPESGVTIGTTAITSGTDGRVLFQEGGVVQQDAAFFWDNTNKSLGVGAVPATNVRLDIRAQNTGTVLRVRRNDDTDDLFSISTTGTAIFRTTQFYNGIDLFNGAGSQIALRTYAGVGMIGANSNGTINFTSTRASVGYGNHIGPQASLDVKAHGALSTDTAFRVRNSADTNDFLRVLGTGDVVVGQLSTTLSNNKALRIDSSGFSKLHFNTSYNAVTTPTGEITINRRQAGFVDDNVFLFSHIPFADGNNKSYKTYYINPSSYYGSTASVDNEGYIAGWSWFRNSRDDANRLMKLSVDGALNLYNRPALPIETNFTDSFQLYSADIIAGNAAPHFRTENGAIIKLYQQSSVGITTVADIVTVLQNLGFLS